MRTYLRNKISASSCTVVFKLMMFNSLSWEKQAIKIYYSSNTNSTSSHLSNYLNITADQEYSLTENHSFCERLRLSTQHSIRYCVEG